MNIAIISGSARVGSLTHRVALHLQQHFQQHTKHDIALVSTRDLNLPPVQAVWSSVEKAPIEFQPLAQIIFDADAIILVSPEYNGSYAPAMKNLVDHFPKQAHKPFGIVTASPGAMGGIRASQQMQLLVGGLFGLLSPHMLITPMVDKKFDEVGNLIDASFQGQVDNFVHEFLWLAENVVHSTELLLN
ncbi:MAG: NAD(P)H-dependent oxidoreductase [Chitinophagaceae bacterium]